MRGEGSPWPYRDVFLSRTAPEVQTLVLPEHRTRGAKLLFSTTRSNKAVTQARGKNTERNLVPHVLWFETICNTQDDSSPQNYFSPKRRQSYFTPDTSSSVPTETTMQ